MTDTNNDTDHRDPPQKAYAKMARKALPNHLPDVPSTPDQLFEYADSFTTEHSDVEQDDSIGDYILAVVDPLLANQDVLLEAHDRVPRLAELNTGQPPQSRQAAIQLSRRWYLHVLTAHVLARARIDQSIEAVDVELIHQLAFDELTGDTGFAQLYGAVFLTTPHPDIYMPGLTETGMHYAPDPSHRDRNGFTHLEWLWRSDLGSFYSLIEAVRDDQPDALLEQVEAMPIAQQDILLARAPPLEEFTFEAAFNYWLSSVAYGILDRDAGIPYIFLGDPGPAVTEPLDETLPQRVAADKDSLYQALDELLFDDAPLGFVDRGKVTNPLQHFYDRKELTFQQ